MKRTFEHSNYIRSTNDDNYDNVFGNTKFQVGENRQSTAFEDTKRTVSRIFTRLQYYMSEMTTEMLLKIYDGKYT